MSVLNTLKTLTRRVFQKIPHLILRLQTRLGPHPPSLLGSPLRRGPRGETGVVWTDKTVTLSDTSGESSEPTVMKEGVSLNRGVDLVRCRTLSRVLS